MHKLMSGLVDSNRRAKPGLIDKNRQIFFKTFAILCDLFN